MGTPTRRVDAQELAPGEAKLARVCLEAGFTKLVEAGQCSVTKLVGKNHEHMSRTHQTSCQTQSRTQRCEWR